MRQPDKSKINQFRRAITNPVKTDLNPNLNPNLKLT
jgi:hypothetical protein